MSKKGAPAAAKSAMPEKQSKKVQHIRKQLPEVSEEAVIQSLTEHDWNAETAIRALKQTDPGELAWSKRAARGPTAAVETPQPKKSERQARNDDRAPRGQGIRPQRSPPRGQEEAAAYELALQIPPNKYGVVVGKGGATMNKINQECNVKCHVPGRGETGPVTIKGTKADCERAQKKLQDIVGEPFEVAARRTTAPAAAAEKPGPKMGGKVIQGARRRAAPEGGAPAATAPSGTVSWRAALTSGTEQSQQRLTPPPEEEAADEYPVAGTPPGSMKPHMRHSPARGGPPVAEEQEARPIRQKPSVQEQVPQGRDVHIAAPSAGARVSVQLKEGKAWQNATVLSKGKTHDEIIVRCDGVAMVGGLPVPLDRVRPADGDTWDETGRADAPSPPPPEHEPTEAEKLREVYDFMDSARRGLVTLREFCAAFELCRVMVEVADIQGLYGKLTGDEPSGQIAFANFRRIMPEHYPLLLDALYWRPREVGMDSRQRDIGAVARRQHEKYQSEEGIIRQRVEDAAAEARTQQDRHRQQEMLIDDSTRREADVNAQLLKLDDTYNVNQEAVDRRKQEQRTALEREKLAHSARRQAEQSCEEHQRRLRLQEESTKRAVDKLNELKRQLAEQQKEVDRLQAGDDEVAERLGVERQKVQTAIGDAENAKMVAETSRDGLLHAEGEMRQVVLRRKEQEDALKRAKDDTERQRRQVDYEAGELDKRRLSEQQLSDEFAKVAALRAEQATRLREIEEQEALRRKEQVEDEKGDNDNIVKQIKLRALQDDLDAQAAALQGARIRRRQV